MHLKILSAKLRPSCPGGDELSIGGCLIWNVCTGGSQGAGGGQPETLNLNLVVRSTD